MLECLAIQTVVLDSIDALYDFAFVVFDQFAIQPYPHRFVRGIFVRLIPSLSFFLVDSLVIIACRIKHQVLAGILAYIFGHDCGVEHHAQQVLTHLHTIFGTLGGEPFLCTLRHKLVGGIMVMNTVGEPHTFEIHLKQPELLVLTVSVIGLIKGLTRTTDGEVILTILVKQDVASP